LDNTENEPHKALKSSQKALPVMGITSPALKITYRRQKPLNRCRKPLGRQDMG